MRRKSCGGVLPLGRTSSINGASLAHCLSLKTPIGLAPRKTKQMGIMLKP